MTSVQPDTRSARSAPGCPICASCGTDEVVRDAWAISDPYDHCWTLKCVFDHAFCKRCEALTTLIWSAMEHGEQYG